MDLLRSVPLVHLNTGEHSPMKRITWITYLLCIANMVFLFRLGSRADDAGLVSGLIVLITFALGSLSPRRAWQWALLVGLSVPLANLFRDSKQPL